MFLGELTSGRIALEKRDCRRQEMGRARVRKKEIECEKERGGDWKKKG